MNGLYGGLCRALSSKGVAKWASKVPADQIAAYYRGVLQRGGWRLVSDTKDQEGAVVLFAERKGPPLWIRVQRADDGNGTLIQLSGAVVSASDSAAAKPAS